ncbi:diaminopimelate epimerase [Hoeflea prorocentri]|uniref:Diaminopimelate epimerase n=1 Tax=Hoeflea prorocentri TaxID=1922333 RepID=A0A9X3ZJE4_9HYPH|nr:diaminopimelate epimerase [Hoeflea prorocentri]MCY6383384.1 diaminopimelate epimerase [Hoeflea prorocentri]MDA5401184.1 diaminopimelate epimerase [Hoeflea prorocentri]
MAGMVQFAKMNGLGNEILVVDMRGRADFVLPEAAIALAGDKATAFDQIMAIHDPRIKGTDAYIDILNSDGSKAQSCGNGTRCVVQALGAETGKQIFTFQTVAGILNAREHEDGMISVDMGTPEFNWEKIPLGEEFRDTRMIELQVGPIDAPVLHSPSAVSMGNPHAVFWVDDDVNSYDLDRFGPLLESHPVFPERANISIARIRSRDELDLRTWERGAGLTRACGSAACAAAVSAARIGRTERRVTVNVPGGPLLIDWNEDNNKVTMTGPAEWEFSGQLDPSTGHWQPDAPQGENRA